MFREPGFVARDYYLSQQVCTLELKYHEEKKCFNANVKLDEKAIGFKAEYSPPHATKVNPIQ